MTKRTGATQHYENLIEKILRDNEILYIAVDETKRPLFDGMMEIWGVGVLE